MAAAAQLTACTMRENVALTNASGTEVRVAQVWAYKTTRHLNETAVPAGSATEVWFDRRILITTGDVTSYYAPSPPPKPYTERVYDVGPFMVRKAYALLGKDGCIRLAAIDAARDKPAVPQPEGFPLCPNEKHNFTTSKPKEEGPSLTEIKALAAKIETWSCPVPPGGERIRPLYALPRDDSAHIREARERVELRRRKSHQSWDAAFSSFTSVQEDFFHHNHVMVMTKFNTQQRFERDAEGGLLVKARNLDYQRWYDLAKNEYDSLCALNQQSIADMLAEEPALARLRKEPDRPWLQAKFRLPCDVVEVPTCWNR